MHSLIVGIGSAVAGGLLTTIAIAAWWLRKAASMTANRAEPTGPGETMAVSFSPMGLMSQPWFWLLIIALFAIGFLISMYLQRR